jgi:hypothetical protein
MYFTVAVEERSPNVWHAQVLELPGAVGSGDRPELALRNAQANASRILTLHLNSEAAHPDRRRFLTSILGSAFQTASEAWGTSQGAPGRAGGAPSRLPVAG